MIVSEFKGLLTIKLKSRTDGYTDQFNRIFIVKILMACSLFMGISWYKDSVNCIVPGSAGINSDFVSSACWIQGVYVYEELKGRNDHVAYYGIPKSIDHDGMYSNGDLCRTEDKFNQKFKNCKPLTKTFFLQYQWMPFYVALLAVFFYLPYVVHLYGNSDMISLKKSIKSGQMDSERVIQTFFNHRLNPVRQLRARIVYNYFIKILYIIANVCSFVFTDKVLEGKFRDYGAKWVRWSKLDNHLQFDYMGAREFPKPGHEVLPPFGYCELFEASLDVKTSLANKHKFVCELSQNILYQYSLIVIWFLLIIGIILSIIGFLLLLIDHLITILCMLKQGAMAKKMYNMLSLRECEYLEFIRKRDLPLYADVLQKLRMERYHMSLANGNPDNLPCDSPPPGFDEALNTRL